MTEYLNIIPGDEPHNDKVLAHCAGIIKGGGLVAFPTETVYGLGANVFDEKALLRIYEAKGRPCDNPLIVHIASVNELAVCVSALSESARLLMEAFWPGPLTMIFPKGPSIPLAATGKRGTVAVRCPAHPIARRLIQAAGTPVAAPSANISGRPSPTGADHVKQDLDGRVDAVLDGGPCPVGIESTIIDMTGEPRLLRPGFITKSTVENVLKHGISQSPATLDTPEAPGMRYAHYAPLAELIIVDGSAGKTVEYINNMCRESGLGAEKLGVFASDETADLYKNARVISAGSRAQPETIARSLFGALRRFDLWGAARVYSEAFYDTELGLSVMNRLEKASGYNIVKL
ncbi:MAG: L-threonylcarbamoyladenylate synthase [Defluviitaleaceae bacterium]|nr:L-threonylcarbamoyladenylate synthase [Defluviitaleaceae bacterium]